MADRGRDLTFNLVTDQSQFDTDQAARDMQRLGDAAEDSGRQQQQMGDDATRAAGDLERLAREAEQAGRAVRDVGDDARAADAGLNQLDDAAEQTGGAFGDMRDEAGAALAETAASFDGTMSGVIDGVQGALPALGMAFGGVGLAIGSALAVGVGLFKARAEKLTEQVNGLVSSLIADGGRLSRESVFSKLEELAADESINKLAEDARLARVPVEDFLLAMAGDRDAIARTSDELERQNDIVAEGVRTRTSDVENLGDYASAYLRVRDALGQGTEAQDRAAEAVARYEEVTGAATAATEKRTAIEEVAAAVADQYAAAQQGVADEAADMAAAIEAGADAVEEAQERQLAAARDLETNTRTVYDRLGQAGLDFALAQGENADEAMQLLANAPVEQGQRIVANWQGLGNASSAAVINGIRASIPGAQAAAAEVVRTIQQGFDNNPIIVRYKPDPSGYRDAVTSVLRNGSVPQ